jgi:hypothetical protein
VVKLHINGVHEMLKAMYDNVDFKLRNTDVSGIDFLSETPCYFDVSGEHDYQGERVITGTLGDVSDKNYFRITVNRMGVNIKDGSMCKWHLGDNFKTLGRGEAKRAIEKLSDTYTCRLMRLLLPAWT